MRLSVLRMTMRAAMMSQKMLSPVMPPARRHSKKMSARPAKRARRDQNFRRRDFMVIRGDLSCLEREKRTNVIWARARYENGWVIARFMRTWGHWRACLGGIVDTRCAD